MASFVGSQVKFKVSGEEIVGPKISAKFNAHLLVRLPKIALSLRKELGTISTVMVQQLPVPFKLMGKNFTSIQIMVDKLKALLHQMVTTTMKTLVNSSLTKHVLSKV